MLRDQFLCSYKSVSRKISKEDICDNRSVNFSDKSVNMNKAPLKQNQFTENNLINY